MRIYVNGTVHDVPRGQISHADIATLAGSPGSHYITVVYHSEWKGDARRSGTLIHGKSIEGEDGMRFDAVHTGNA